MNYLLTLQLTDYKAKTHEISWVFIVKAQDFDQWNEY